MTKSKEKNMSKQKGRPQKLSLGMMLGFTARGMTRRQVTYEVGCHYNVVSRRAVEWKHLGVWLAPESKSNDEIVAGYIADINRMLRSIQEEGK